MAVFSALRAMYRPSVMQWARAGMSARGIERKLKSDFGLAYRWQDIAKDVRWAKGLQKKQALVEKLPIFERPSKGYILETDLKQPFRYRMIGEATVQDKTTLAFSTRTVSIYSDTAYSPDEASDYFVNMQGTRAYTMDVEWVSFKVQSYEHNRGMSY